MTISVEQYHAGPDDTPRLSASIATILCTRTALHAYTAHPKLNPYYERVEEEKFDVGKAAHSVLLEGDDCVYVVHEDSWRKQVAQEAREYARSIGKVPLLAAKRDEVMRMVDAVRLQLKLHDAEPPLFTDGQPEVSLLWEENGVAFKARLDWLASDNAVIDDLKTTARSAHPESYSRTLFGVGGEIQAALYRRAVRATAGADALFRWAVVETSPPFALSVITPSSEMLALGEAKIEWAIERWRICMENGRWEGYGADVHVAEVPAWEESRWLEHEAREELVA